MTTISSRDDDVLKNLVAKTGGLPKVIVEIATQATWMDRARSINNKFIQELKNTEEFGRLQGLFCWMQLYLRNRPDSLKTCILYLPVFSPEVLIRRRRLVRRWIAEGYSRDSHEESAEEKGEKQFLDLLDLGIVQLPSTLLGLDGTTTRFVSCHVNLFFREYILSQLMEENLVFELDGTCAVTTERTGRHLSISRDWDRDKIVFKNINFSRLRSLTVSGKWESFFVSESMKLLRVLDLEDASNVKDSDLKKIVKGFPRLKFLSLRGCTEIYHLPSSIGDLRQLQTLDVRHTSIVALPVNITMLDNLQYLRAGRSNTPPIRHLVGVKMPPGIQKLTAFHTLGIVNVSARINPISELKNITQLCKVEVSGINKGNSRECFSALSNLIHLKSLSVWLDKNNECCLDDISLEWKRFQSLRSLKLYGIGDKLPEWRELFNKLTKIDLDMITVTDRITFKSIKTQQGDNIEVNDSFAFLGSLLNLCILRIRVKQFEDDKLHVCSILEYGVERDSFKNVKILEISCSSRVYVAFGLRAMQKLEQLKVECSMEYKFDGLYLLRELKEVCVKGWQDNKEDLLSQLDKNKTVVKLEEL